MVALSFNFVNEMASCPVESAERLEGRIMAMSERGLSAPDILAELQTSQCSGLHLAHAVERVLERQQGLNKLTQLIRRLS